MQKMDGQKIWRSWTALVEGTPIQSHHNFGLWWESYHGPALVPWHLLPTPGAVKGYCLGRSPEFLLGWGGVAILLKEAI